jgi:hypothetical protein
MTPKPKDDQPNRRSRLFAALALFSLAAVLTMGALVTWSCSYTIRTAVRWPVGSERYKSEVLAQPTVTGELKHIEWDGWGWAAQDTTVYLVFDPTDSLATPARTHQPGKFGGIPCEVPVVKRLEKDWYLVQFYTDEWWGKRNALDCTSSGS